MVRPGGAGCQGAGKARARGDHEDGKVCACARFTGGYQDRQGLAQARAWAVTNTVKASKSVVESKKSNGLDEGGEIPHPAGKAKGPRARAVAKIYPEPKRGAHSELNKSTGLGFDKAYLCSGSARRLGLFPRAGHGDAAARAGKTRAGK